MKEFKESSLALSVVQHCLDWIALGLSSIVAYRIYMGSWQLKDGYSGAIALALVLLAWTFSKLDLYRSWRGEPFFTEMRQSLVGIAIVFLILGLLATLTKTGASYSRGWGMLWFILSVLNICALRLILRRILSELRMRGLNRRKIAVVGSSTSARKVLDQVLSQPNLGIEVVSVFLDDAASFEDGSVEFYGVPRSVEELTDISGIDEVWIAAPLRMEDFVRDILHLLRHSTADIRYIPDLFGIRLLNHGVASVAGLSVINFSATPMVGVNKLIKYAEDFFLSVFFLVLTFPLFIVLSVGVKFSSPGPIFYRQVRVGWNGKSFSMLKFRSMEVDADEAVRWGGAKDKKVTSFGKFIRKTSLDELPQFINVLKGEMSIVGPRPERVEFVSQFKDEIPGYMQKHMVKAGITGWAQINGYRGDTDLNSRIEHDLEYIENWSLWLDLKIIFLTPIKGVVMSNAN